LGGKKDTRDHSGFQPAKDTVMYDFTGKIKLRTIQNLKSNNTISKPVKASCDTSGSTIQIEENTLTVNLRVTHGVTQSNIKSTNNLSIT